MDIDAGALTSGAAPVKLARDLYYRFTIDNYVSRGEATCEAMDAPRTRCAR